MYLQLGSKYTLVVSSAQTARVMAREVFKTHDLIFSGRPSLYGGNKLTYDSVSLSFSPYGEYWRL
ncbi:putative 5-epiaristolochene 1,3-dihydroxylase [Rosa chinensis]|nr:putative 5-epiaristolochene 1,3-dihydroxylase [Rosa chinensis]